MALLGDNYVRIAFYVLSLVLLATVFSQEFSATSYSHLINNYWHFFAIGIIAATIANATGAGGGIVFLPAFSLLGMSVEEAVATSFAIQCFGMTSGSLTWLGLVRKEQNSNQLAWKDLNFILLISTTASLCGLTFAYQLIPQPPIKIHILFSVFSIIVGVVILKRALSPSSLESNKLPTVSIKAGIFIFISIFIGGMITAWLSIGVGELLVIVLVALGYNARFAIACAVCISSITVLAAIPNYVAGEQIHYAVLVFAAPAALIGGFVARHLATMVSMTRLKAIFASWIIVSGLSYLLIS